MPAPDPKTKSKKHLINKDPQKYNDIVSGLKKGKGLVELASIHNVAPATVQKIREDNAEVLPSWKRRTVQALSEAAEGIARSLAEGHENIPWQSKALSCGILLSKCQELTGNMPQKTVVHEHKLTHSSLVDKFKSLKAGSPEVIDVTRTD